MCLTNIGAFTGSKACLAEASPWRHALLEAWRHRQIFMNQSAAHYPNKSYLQRIWFFGKNKESALSQIRAANIPTWTEPKIILHTAESLGDGKAWIWRTLCKGYQGLHEGDLDRFVY